MKKLIFYFLSLLLLSGCATYSYVDAPATYGGIYSKYAQIGYEGDLQLIDDVGIITTDSIINIQTLDGEPISKFRLLKKAGLYIGGRYQLHLLPGTYKIGMSFYLSTGSGYRASRSDLSKIITIKKGEIVHLSWVDQGKRWNVKESDGIAAIVTMKDDFNELMTIVEK